MTNPQSLLVFVVDDDETVSIIIKEALVDGGFSVTIANNAEQAMTMLDSKDIDYSALITDVKIGSEEITGWDIAKKSREINPSIPVVYMTGSEGHEWNSRGVPNSLLLIKPFAMAQVVTAVSQLLTAASTSST